MGNRLIKIYVEGVLFFNKQNCTVFCNMVMLRVNIGRNIATLDGHAIQLNKYFNKYEMRMVYVLRLHLHTSTNFLS